MGDYDTLTEPVVITKGWDYICLTNNHALKVNSNSIWQVFPIVDKKLSDVKLARKCKMLFWNIGPLKYRRYDINIWHDANIQINCDLNEFTEDMNDYLYILNHPERFNILDEVNFCVSKDKGDKNVLFRQMQHYISDGFPDKEGLCGSGLIVRRDTPNVRRLMHKWFDEIKKYSSRDQVSFNYVLWKYPIPINYIPFNTINTKFIKRFHNRAFIFRINKLQNEIQKMIFQFKEENKFDQVFLFGQYWKDKNETKINYEL